MLLFWVVLARLLLLFELFLSLLDEVLFVLVKLLELLLKFFHLILNHSVFGLKLLAINSELLAPLLVLLGQLLDAHNDLVFVEQFSHLRVTLGHFTVLVFASATRSSL